MILSIHSVSPGGEIALVAANVPYSNVQWNRAFSTCGTFQVELACDLPVEWPGRYIVTRDDRREVGVLEKVDSSEEAGGSPPVISGRFAESLFDRWKAGTGGASCRGATWRQAATEAMLAWHMGDLPPLKVGDGCQRASGSSYAIACDEGKSGMEAIYAATAANGAYPLVTYDRDADPGRLVLEIVEGLDRTRAQSERPFWLFSLAMGTANSISYSGDYSCACSEVLAHAERDGTGDDPGESATATVAVPGFEAASQWEQRAFEDVGSLIDDEDPITQEAVSQAGLLRSYDRMASLSIECADLAGGYADGWDLGDTVDVEMPSMGLSASQRVEECREVLKKEGGTVEAVLGNKRISRVRRALMGRR